MPDASLTDPYRRLREDAGLVDLNDRGTVAITGGDRATYLQGLLTNDVVALRAHTGCYAAYLTPQGRMIADMRVLELGDRMLLDVDRALAGKLAQRLSMLVFSEDVQVADETATWYRLGVRGPAAATRLAGTLSTASGPARPLAEYGEFDSGWWTLAGKALLAVRNDELAVPGFDLWIAVEHGPALLAQVTAAGLARTPTAAADLLRVEAGTPRFGVDMDEETIPLEAGIEGRALSESKGCYVGQEVIVRILHRGHGRVARKLVGLVFDPEAEVPVSGDVVLDGEAEIGRVTSAVRSPRLERPIALAYVKREHTAPGTGVQVAVSGATVAARVSSLPF